MLVTPAGGASNPSKNTVKLFAAGAVEICVPVPLEMSLFIVSVILLYLFVRILLRSACFYFKVNTDPDNGENQKRWAKPNNELSKTRVFV